MGIGEFVIRARQEPHTSSLATSSEGLFQLTLTRTSTSATFTMGRPTGKASNGVPARTLSAVKSGSVTKLSQTPRSRSKELAKKVATKMAREQTDSSDEDSDSSASSESSNSEEEEDEDEHERPATTKMFPTATAKQESESDESASSDDDDDDDDDEDDEDEDKEVDEKPKVQASAKVGGMNGVSKKEIKNEVSSLDFLSWPLEHNSDAHPVFR